MTPIFGQISSKTHSEHFGLRALQIFRPCEISQCGNITQSFFGDELAQILFDLFGRGFFGQTESLRKPRNVRVDDDARSDAESVSENDVRGFSRDAV